MINLSQIFPVNYPNLPSEEDLLFEVLDMLHHADSPIDILRTINKIACPYYRKAIASMTPAPWRDMERMGKEPAVYIDSDGHGRFTWINIDADMRQIIKQANAEQVALEQQPPITEQPKPKTNNQSTTIMPLFINKQEGTIYNNCTIYQGVTPPQTKAELQVAAEPQTAPAEQNLPIAPALLCLDKHSISVIERKIKQALEVPTKTKACANLYALQREGYINLDQYRSDEERAQALNRYQTTYVFSADDIQRGRAKR